MHALNDIDVGNVTTEDIDKGSDVEGMKAAA